MANRVLLAVHDPSTIRCSTRVCKIMGCEYDLAADKEELLTKARQGNYQRGIMDANFPSPGSLNVAISKQVYDLLREKYPEIQFMAISGDPQVVEATRALGVPAEEKMSFDMINFLR